MKTLPQYITHTQVKDLFQSTKNLKPYIRQECVLVMQFMYFAGLRVSEATSVTPSQISFEPNEETIRLYGKGKRERLVPIVNTPLLEHLSFIRMSNPDLLPDQTYITKHRTTVWRWINTLGKQNNIKLSPHTLRHSYARNLILLGNVPITVVQKVLGHEFLQTTYRYAEISDNFEDIKNAMRTMNYD